MIRIDEEKVKMKFKMLTKNFLIDCYVRKKE